jgi:hypothetical protein
MARANELIAAKTISFFIVLLLSEAN